MLNGDPDSPGLANSTKLALEELGYDVVFRGNGEAAEKTIIKYYTGGEDVAATLAASIRCDAGGRPDHGRRGGAADRVRLGRGRAGAGRRGGQQEPGTPQPPGPEVVNAAEDPVPERTGRFGSPWFTGRVVPRRPARRLTAMREAYHDQLGQLAGQLADMCAMAGDAMERATAALLDADLALAEQVIGDDVKIDDVRAGIEEQAYALLALQAPVATDLRIVLAVIHAAESVERMGDLALHVAKAARRRHPNHVLADT
ncbi:hypothetical protein K7G98_17925, partial [Saccharothrix sp. MB29]|nr:hypothetical protein [Saccharothrix sp. MB29]